MADPHRTLVHPDDRERVARFVAEAALRPGVTAAGTWRVRHRDGTWLHSETVAANLLEDPQRAGAAGPGARTATSCSIPTCTRTCSSAWSWRPSCATSPTATSWSCTTSRSSSWSRAASPGSRPWSAGSCSRPACRPGAGRTSSPTRRRCRCTSTCPAASSRSSAWSARWSSLSHLRRFPIDMLKIDKAFVDGIGRGREETALAHAIVKLSHTPQLDAMAEGIEEAEQAASLVTLGCRDGQGYHFARPLTAAAMTELLGKTLADGGFYPPNAAAPVESLSG